MRRFILALVAGILALSPRISAQTTPNLETGYTLFGSFHGSDVDQVNLNNGKLELRIPLLSYPQRGGKLHLGFSIHYSSPVYTETKNCYPIGPGNTNVCADIWDWSGPPLVDVVPDFGMYVGGSVINWGGAQLVTTTVTSFDGAVHDMGNLDNTFNQTNGYRPSLWEATDGSKIKLQEFPDRSMTITDSDGTKYSGTGLQMEDVNGNQVTWGSNGYLDTVGRSIPLPPRTDGAYPTFNGNAALCSGPLPTIGAAAWNVPGYNNQPTTITFCYASVTINPPLPGPPPPPNFPDQRTPGGTYPLLQSIVLPQQPGQPAQAYMFQYDTASGFADLLKVTLPSGGSISYAWGDFRGCHYPPQDEIDLETRSVGTRTVYDGATSNMWTYAVGDTRIGSTNQTGNTVTVTDPAGNKEVHTFTNLAGCSFYETRKDSYQLINGAQSLLNSAQTQYSYQLDPNGDPNLHLPAGAINVFPILVTTSWADGQTSSVEKLYDGGFTTYGISSTLTTRYGSLITEKEHDYGQNSAGPVIRQDATTFQWQVNPQYVTYNLMDSPYQQQVLDGSGNLAAQTTFYYDGASSPTGTPSSPTISGFGAAQELNTSPVNGAYRGNPTSVIRYLATGTSPTTTNIWYDTGEMKQTTDPGGHTTTYSYDTAHGAFLTQTCLPSTAGVAHCTGGGYDTNTGLLTRFTDQNNQLTQYGYDSLLRLHSVSFPDLGGRTYSYTDGTNPRIDVSEVMDSSTNITSSILFDGLGRKKQTQLTSDPEGIDYTDTGYDTLGRVGSVSNPYRTVTDPTNGTTQYAYDPLGRIRQVTKQDNNTVTTDYSNFPTVTITDETGRQRRSRSDALGRVVEVDEPGWFSGSPAAGSINIGSINGNGTDQSVQIQSSGPTQATGWVLISGAEKPAKRIPCTNQIKVRPGAVTSAKPSSNQTAPIGALYPCYVTAYDSGSIGVTVNGTFAGGVDWGKGSDSGTMSANLVNSINGNGSSPVTAYLNGAYVMLTSKASGSGTNYSLSVSVVDDDPTDWPAPSFGASASGPNLTGGADASYSTVYDTGTVTVTVTGPSSVTETVPYDQSSSPSSIAGAIAGKFNSDGNPLVTAANSGGALTLTAKTSGAGISYSISGSSATSQGQYFGSPSFSAGSGSVAGGQNPGPGGLAYPFVTTYQYNARGDLTDVNQAGDGSAPRTRHFDYDTLSRLTSATNPESGTTQYAYTIDPTCNPDGLLNSMTDGRGLSTTYCYDGLHRITKKSYSDGSSSREYYYDQGGHGSSIGRLTHASNDVNAAYDPTYDVMGRVISQTYCIPSDCSYGVSVNAQYDRAGHLTWLTYPSGRKVHNFYTAGDRLKQIVFDSINGTGVNYPYYTTAQSTSASAWGYSPSGLLQRGSYGNGVQQFEGYNSRLQLNAISQSFSGTTLFNKSYNYNDASRGNGNNGNVIAITDNLTASHNQAFNYDDLNRIASGSQADGAFSQTFSYDPWGNLTQSGTWSFQQPYTGNNRLQNYSYDGAGDLLNDGFHNYTYDAERRLQTVDGNAAVYTYGPDGERVRKDTGGSFTEYVYFAGQPIAEKTPSNWTDYVFDGSERIAKATGSSSSGTQYYHADHLGSVRLMTDASGTLISNCLYAPFGEQVSCSPDNASNHYKFTGKERDPESGSPSNGLDYFGARYYSSTMGRWMSPDWSSSPEPVPYANLKDPQTLNLYGYVRNDPLSETDPDGHCCSIDDVLDFAAGFGNAYGSDNLLGAGRMDQSSTAGRMGAAFGDAAATIQGAGETIIGGGGEVLGVGLDATGAGAVLGVPINVISTGMVVHGTATGLTGGANLIKDANVTDGTKPYQDTPANQERMQQGKPPVGNDGSPVELHHDGQTTSSPTKEMTKTDHRLGDNYKKNHANTGQQPSQVDRNQAAKQRREHWKNKANDNQ